MSLPKYSFFSTITLLLISPGYSDSAKYQLQQQQKQHVPIITAYQSRNTPPYWEYILREFVFKTISPPPPGNYVLYKRLLDAPFYSGPFPVVSNDDASVVLSRGDVYYLPNSHWLLCQEGCVSCEVCDEQKNPTVKWVLRRIKRLSSHGSHRHDLQLTIIPQIDGSYRMKNLWPRSFVYVTSPGELAAYSIDKSGYDAGSAFTNHEDSFSGQQQRPRQFWRTVEKDSMPDRRVPHVESNERTTQRAPENNSPENDVGMRTTGVTKEETPDNNQRFRNIRKQRPRWKVTEKPVTETSIVNDNNLTGSRRDGMKQLLPKLILGADQRGQKHLVHVVPADQVTGTTLRYPVAAESPVSVPPEGSDRSIRLPQNHNRSNYQRILRRIFDSLNSQRRSIEDFLEPSQNNGNPNQEVTQSGRMNNQHEEHQEEETRSDLTELQQVGHPSRDFNENKIHRVPYKRWPLTLNWNRQRRKAKSDINVNNLSNVTNSSFRNLNNNYSINDAIPLTSSDGVSIEENEKKNIPRYLRTKSLDPHYYGENKFNDTYDVNKSELNHELKSVPRRFNVIVSTDSTTKLKNHELTTIANRNKDTKDQSK